MSVMSVMSQVSTLMPLMPRNFLGPVDKAGNGEEGNKDHHEFWIPRKSGTSGNFGFAPNVASGMQTKMHPDYIIILRMLNHSLKSFKYV